MNETRQKLLDELVSRFLAAPAPESDAALVREFHAFYIEFLRVGLNLSTQIEAEALIRSKAEETPESFELAFPHGVVRHWAQGQAESATKFVESYFQFVKRKHAEKSRKASRSPRRARRDDFSKLIDEIVRAKPAITRRQLHTELQQFEYGEVVDRVYTGYVLLVSGEEITVSGLQGRLARSRKRLS